MWMGYQLRKVDPYHDADGRFTSAGGEGAGSGKLHILPGVTHEQGKGLLKDFFGLDDEKEIARSLGKDLPKGVRLEAAVYVRPDFMPGHFRGELRCVFKNEQGDEIGYAKRSFRQGVVYHDSFKVEEKYRKHGLGSVFIKNSMALYRQGSVKRIDLIATKGNGAYTWARMGFKPDEDYARNVVQDIRRLFTKLPNKSNALEEALRYNDYRGVWGIADAPEGARLLADKHWQGGFYMKDQEQNERFDRYMDTRKKSEDDPYELGTLNEAESILIDIEGPEAVLNGRRWAKENREILAQLDADEKSENKGKETA